jgi:SAM-dependent methyltransferase
MIPLARSDNLGAVYLAEDQVYRVVSPQHRSAVERVLARLGTELESLGMVDTGACSAAETERLGFDTRDLVLKHRRIPLISYPHEWCASMLREAAISQMELARRLLERELYLKDAHPWNTLFECGRPIFVDILSVVDAPLLAAEDYLRTNRGRTVPGGSSWLADVTAEICRRMFVPYFLEPLCAYAYGNRGMVPGQIQRITLNASTSELPLRALVPARPWSRKGTRKLAALAGVAARLHALLLRLKYTEDVSAFMESMVSLVQGLPVAPPMSDYSGYYAAKSEDAPLDDPSRWNPKQTGVHEALGGPEIVSVLDVGCNTGWYSRLAAHLGKRVLALDQDEACIEWLHGDVCKNGKDILPLVANITALTRNRYSIMDGRRILMAAEDRFKCDAVLALALLHHLVLGEGLSLEDSLGRLSTLAKRRLVVEFVGVDDKLVVPHGPFFRALATNPNMAKSYTLENAQRILSARFRHVQVRPSHPSTRTLLVCDHPMEI